MTVSTVVDGARRRVGEVFEADWRLADVLLRSGSALPADPEGAQRWRHDMQPQRPSGWVRGWQLR